MSQVDRERLREEAAAWVVRMAGPEARQWERAFERWLTRDAAHPIAYERLSARFAHSQILERSTVYSHPRARPPFLWWGAAVMGGLAAAAAMLISLAHLPAIFGITGAGSSPASGVGSRNFEIRITAPRTTIRSIDLPDGSHLALDAGSVLSIAYDDGHRRLRLFQGRVRFDVAHDHRPFIVAAGPGSVEAHGTLFDVTILSGRRIRVSLLRGAIDVRLDNAKGGPSSIRHLAPRQEAEFDEAGFVRTPVLPSNPTIDWPQGLLDVEAIPLPDLVAQANHYASRPFELDGADLANLRISGRFRIDQPERFAQHLADLFQLTIDRSHPDHIVLKKYRPEAPHS